MCRFGSNSDHAPEKNFSKAGSNFFDDLQGFEGS